MSAGVLSALWAAWMACFACGCGCCVGAHGGVEGEDCTGSSAGPNGRSIQTTASCDEGAASGDNTKPGLGPWARVGLVQVLARHFS